MSKTVHSHAHRHTRSHPHAAGYRVSVQHDHEHVHQRVGRHPELPITGSWGPDHRPHQHTPEQEADLQRQQTR